jgi:hypothetical protein
MTGSRTARGFGFGSGMEFAADLRIRYSDLTELKASKAP